MGARGLVGKSRLVLPVLALAFVPPTFAQNAAVAPPAPASTGVAPASSPDAAPVLPKEPAPAPPVAPASIPTGPRVEWSVLGPSIQPTIPRIATLVTLPKGVLVVGYEVQAEDQALSQFIDLSSRKKLSEQQDRAPLSMIDGRGNLCAISFQRDSAQLIMRQESPSGARGVRLVKVPQPVSASAAFPYLNRAGHFAPDGTLLLIGSGKDRLYRVNLALGEARAILPDQPLDIMDFDVTTDGEYLVLDGYEQRLVWLNQAGEVVAQSPLSKNEGRIPQYFYLSVAAAEGRTAWVGLTVRQPDGSFAAEVQRVQGKLRQRLSLSGEHGTLGMPLTLADDGSGGVVVADEKNFLLQISSSVQPGRPLEAPGVGTDAPGGKLGSRQYLTDTGVFVSGLEASMEAIMPELNGCYEKLRQVSKKAKGSYHIQLGTQDHGIEKIDVYQKDFEDFGLESCVSRALRSLKFSQRVGQQTLRIALKFVSPARS